MLNPCVSKRATNETIARKIETHKKCIIEDPIKKNVFALQLLHGLLHALRIVLQVIIAQVF
jgi:hypothetical protein